MMTNKLILSLGKHVVHQEPFETEVKILNELDLDEVLRAICDNEYQDLEWDMVYIRYNGITGAKARYFDDYNPE